MDIAQNQRRQKKTRGQKAKKNVTMVYIKATVSVPAYNENATNILKPRTF